MCVEIRKTRLADLKTVKRIEVENNLGAWSEESYQAEIDRTDSLFYVAETLIKSDAEKQVVGFILARPIMYNQLSFDSPIENEIEIYNIAVQKNLRKIGIGTRLLEKICESAIEKRVARIHLEVRKSNLAAINFYRQNDFTIIGERRNFYANPIEDGLLLCRTLHS